MMENEITEKIIGAAIEVHRTLGGPGLLESVYQAALCHELSLQNMRVQTQLPVQINYKGSEVRDPLYLDLLVENLVLVEVKATSQDHSIYESQVLTYLRLSGIKLGLLINFGRKQVKDGISRIVNGL